MCPTGHREARRWPGSPVKRWVLQPVATVASRATMSTLHGKDCKFRHLGATMDVVAFLRFGAIGLGLLLTVLAYRLLARDTNPTPIYLFMLFSVMLMITGAASIYFDNASHLKTLQDSNETLTQEISIAQKEISDIRLELTDARSKSEAILAGQRTAIQTVEDSLLKLDKLADYASSDSCPGGGNGIPSNHADDIQRLNGEIIAGLSSLRGALALLAQ